MKLVVTGGAGFLGARLISTLLSGQPPAGFPQFASIVSVDLAPCPVDDPRVQSVTGNITGTLAADETGELQAIPRKQRAEVRRALGFDLDVVVEDEGETHRAGIDGQRDKGDQRRHVLAEEAEPEPGHGA